MYMIEITEDKVCDLSKNIERGLKYMGKAMQCIESMKSLEYEEDDDDDYEDYNHKKRSRSDRGFLRMPR